MTERRLLAGLLATVFLLFQVAFAQYSQKPFFEYTLELSQAYGIQLSLQRLDALELVDEYVESEEHEDDDDEEEEGLDDDYVEIVEGFEADLVRYVATLRALNPALADDVVDAIEALEEAVEEGEDYDEEVIVLRVLLQEAYDVVVPAGIRNDPAFVGALIAELSLGEGGVGEGYEEAVEGELGAYTMGYAALDRVEALWGQLVHLANAQQVEDIEEMFAFLHSIYPEPVIEERIAGNPEEAEAPVQRLLGVLETVVDAELFAGRDMVALTDFLPEALAGYCELYDEDEEGLALEGVVAVSYLYLTADLGEFLGFMAPEVHEEALELIFALTGLEPEDDDDDDAADEEGEEDEDDDDDDDLDAEDLCHQLREVFREARGVFGG